MENQPKNIPTITERFYHWEKTTPKEKMIWA